MKPFNVKIAAKSLYSLRANKNFMLKKVWLINRKDAPNADNKDAKKAKKGFMMPFAQNAAHKQKFRSNPLKEKKSIAKNASTKDNNKHKTKDLRKTGFALFLAKPVF